MGDIVLGIMNDFYVCYFFIVNDKQLFGLIFEEDILEYDVYELVGFFQFLFICLYVKYNDYFYEILCLIVEYYFILILVVDEEENYIGFVIMEDVLQYFIKIVFFFELGSIVVLEMSCYDYQFLQIVQIVEFENVVVFSVFIIISFDFIWVDVIIKINW